MSPESFDRLQSPSKEDFDRFIAWLFSRTLAELREARGDMPATQAAWIRYFRRGLKAHLLLDELMTHLPELFGRARYAADEAPNVLAIIKTLNFSDLGIERTESGVRFDGNVG